MVNLNWPKFADYLYLERKLDRSNNASYFYLFKKITEYFRDKDFNRDNIIAFFAYKQKLGLTNSTLNQYLKLLKHLCRYLKVDYMEGFTYFKKVYRKQRIMTQEEVDLIINTHPERGNNKDPEYINQRYTAAITFLSVTGVRVGELCNLKWDDLSPTSFTVNASHSKTDKEREIPITPDTYNLIKKLTKFKHGYVFGSERGPMSIKTIACEIKHRAKLANIKNWNDIHPHSFRHYFTVHKLKNHPIDRISKILGHADISTTAKYYGHYNTEALRSVVNETTEVDRITDLEAKMSLILERLNLLIPSQLSKDIHKPPRDLN